MNLEQKHKATKKIPSRHNIKYEVLRRKLRSKTNKSLKEARMLAALNRMFYADDTRGRHFNAISDKPKKPNNCCGQRSQYNSQYYRENKDKIYQQQVAYRSLESSKQKIKEANARYRAKIKADPVKHAEYLAKKRARYAASKKNKK
jgi:hypothetical protein